MLASSCSVGKSVYVLCKGTLILSVFFVSIKVPIHFKSS